MAAPQESKVGNESQQWWQQLSEIGQSSQPRQQPDVLQDPRAIIQALTKPASDDTVCAEHFIIVTVSPQAVTIYYLPRAYVIEGPWENWRSHS